MKCIEGAERDALILSIIKRIERDTQEVGALSRSAVWEDGWHEALRLFKANPVVETLRPAFIHVNQPVRWQQDFWMPDAEQNELTHIELMQAKLGDHLKDCDVIYEFGCGTGYNLAALAKRFPDKTFIGCDLSTSAVQLVNEAGWALQLPMQAYHFDMICPNSYMRLAPNAGAFTHGSIEQLPGRYEPFFEWLIAQKPKVVCHIEPAIELLDPSNLVDALAIAFMRKRGYAENVLTWLRSNGAVDLYNVERTGFGSLMIEAYNLFCWRPHA